MLSRFSRHIFSLLAASTLSACATGVVTSPALIDSSYDPAELAYAVKEGPIYTEIIGQPFPGQAKVVSEVVTKTFQETQITGHHIPFTAERAKAGKSPYRLIVLFDPAPSANPDRLCARTDEKADWPQVEGEAGKVRMMVAFCDSATSKASLTGYTSAPSPSAPQFKKLIQQASLDLFSSRSIGRRSDSDFDQGI